MLTGRVTLIAGRVRGGSVMLTACGCIGAALVVVALRSVAIATTTRYLYRRVNMSSLGTWIRMTTDLREYIF
jgi:hypothetical protein